MPINFKLNIIASEPIIVIEVLRLYTCQLADIK